MSRSMIFIASSERTLDFAAMLRNELNQEGFCEAHTWKDAIDTTGAQAKIEALEQWIRKYDFAIIVLSRADLIADKAGGDLKSRDDCVFEAGLFMAAIGRHRCFLLSSVEKRDLPSDLGGINLLKFVEPRDLGDRNECRIPIQNAAGFILPWIQRETGRGVPNRPLSRTELLERERLESEGGQLKEDEVVVASVQPLELEYEAAKQVRLNLDNNIRYIYFFEANDDATDKVPQLLQLVLLAGLLQKEEDFKTRAALVKSHSEEIVAALRDICVNDKLNVFFFGESLDLEYCIYNAGSDKFGRLYLKHGDDYIEWESGPQAHGFWRSVREKNGANDPEIPNAVFHATRGYELKEGRFLRNLTTGIRKYFSPTEVADEVIRLCLKGPG